MKCPVCQNELCEQNFGIKVDVCENGCKSIWFDNQELKVLDENDEGLGKALETALRHPRNNTEDREKIQCPKCNIPMQIHKYKRAQEVNIDECYKCGGIFLDSGELKEIRDNYMDDAEVQSYLNELLNTVPGYNEAIQKLEDKKQRLEKFEHLTRFLRIKYWRNKFS